MPGEVCDVCGGEAIGVAASSLAGASFAYCAYCVEYGLEPYGVLVSTVFACPLEDIDPAYLAQIDASLKRAGKTREDLEGDAGQMGKDYEEDMEKRRIG